MAGDDGRAQVQLDEDTLARRRRDLGEDHPDTGASATFAIFLRTPRMLLKPLGGIPEEGVRVEVRVSSPRTRRRSIHDSQKRKVVR